MKIAIIGAGPAGVNCAYWASKKGHEVIIFERKEVLASKPCGEGVFKEAFDFVPVSPEGSKWALNYIDKATLYYENKVIAEIETKPFDGYIINKRAFLEDILNEAINLGARFIREEFKIEKDFDLIVDAGGYTSTFARRKGLPYKGLKHAPALRGYGKTNKIREDTLYLEIYDFGYSWIFPYGKGFCNFGIGGHISSKSLMLEKLYHFIKLFDIEVVSKIEGAAFPFTGVLDRLKIGNVVVAGDSAGMVMPISGEGIRFALYAGKICFEDNYEELFMAKYGKKLKEGKKLLDFWLSLNGDELAELVKNLHPYTLAKAFLEGERPNIIEGLKFIKRPRIVTKALMKVYI